MPRVVKIIDMESIMVTAKDGGEGAIGIYCLISIEFHSFAVIDEKSSGDSLCNGCTII